MIDNLINEHVTTDGFAICFFARFALLLDKVGCISENPKLELRKSIDTIDKVIRSLINK